MYGIDLNRPIKYHHACFRFFNDGEHHISRTCSFDVLLLVYDGVLRFREDGTDYELHPGQYHIQRKGSIQSGEKVSDRPKYLFVHFFAEWSEYDENALSSSGTFDYLRFKPLIDELNTVAHSPAPYIQKAAKLYELLSALYQTQHITSIEPTARRISRYISKECHRAITLEQLCEEFHFSKNHIINIMRRNYGLSPIAYANQIRLQKAEYLLEVSSVSVMSIAEQCGFQNYSNFYKLFCRRNNVSPEKWRQNKQNYGK